MLCWSSQVIHLGDNVQVQSGLCIFLALCLSQRCSRSLARASSFQKRSDVKSAVRGFAVVRVLGVYGQVSSGGYAQVGFSWLSGVFFFFVR